MKTMKWQQMTQQYDLERPVEVIWRWRKAGMQGDWFRLARATDRLIWVWDRKKV